MRIKGSFDEDNRFRAPLNSLVDPRLMMPNSVKNAHSGEVKGGANFTSQFVKDADIKKMKLRQSESVKNLKRIPIG